MTYRTKSSALALAGSLLAASALSQEPAVPSEKVLTARTGYLMALGGDHQPGPGNPIPEATVNKPVAQAELAKAMRKWGRFEIVEDVSKTDIVLVVVEWEDQHRWGNTVVCRDQLFVFDASNPQAQSAARLMIDATFKDGFNLLSDKIFERRNGKLLAQE